LFLVTPTDLEACIKITANDSGWINEHRSTWIERVKQLGSRGSTITGDSDADADPAVGARYLHLVMGSYAVLLLSLYGGGASCSRDARSDRANLRPPDPFKGPPPYKS
jgi:hypothetical protein